MKEKGEAKVEVGSMCGRRYDKNMPNDDDNNSEVEMALQKQPPFMSGKSCCQRRIKSSSNTRRKRRTISCSCRCSTKSKDATDSSHPILERRFWVILPNFGYLVWFLSEDIPVCFLGETS